MDSFAGKVAVVTGGASGIGLAMARRFATEGMRVVVADVEAAALEEAAKGLADEFGDDNVLHHVTDVREPEALDALADATFDRFGAAHVVCNNAGIGVGGLAWTIPADRWRWIVDVNLTGVVNGVRSFVPRLIEQGEGHVVNTASVAGIVTAPAMGPYVATKHAVVGFTESLYLDLQLTGAPVGVSVLCPEWVQTRIFESERNRPDDVSEMTLPGADGGEAAPVPAEGVRSVVETLVSSGIDPADVAEKVLAGIREQRFWIFTHDTSVDAAARRHRAIETDGTPVFWGVGG
ncbi:MAG TPA: SDR family NAD(P)-dependent oxidoreductase [Acidimicrobiales bacterium]